MASELAPPASRKPPRAARNGASYGPTAFRPVFDGRRSGRVVFGGEPRPPAPLAGGSADQCLAFSLARPTGAVGKLNTGSMGRDYFRQETAQLLEYLRARDSRYLASVHEQRQLWDEGTQSRWLTLDGGQCARDRVSDGARKTAITSWLRGGRRPDRAGQSADLARILSRCATSPLFSRRPFY